MFDLIVAIVVKDAELDGSVAQSVEKIAAAIASGEHEKSGVDGLTNVRVKVRIVQNRLPNDVGAFAIFTSSVEQFRRFFAFPFHFWAGFL